MYRHDARRRELAVGPLPLRAMSDSVGLRLPKPMVMTLVCFVRNACPNPVAG